VGDGGAAAEFPATSVGAARAAALGAIHRALRLLGLGLLLGDLSRGLRGRCGRGGARHRVLSVPGRVAGRVLVVCAPGVSRGGVCAGGEHGHHARVR
jgi:hypothetical protein